MLCFVYNCRHLYYFYSAIQEGADCGRGTGFCMPTSEKQSSKTNQDPEKTILCQPQIRTEIKKEMKYLNKKRFHKAFVNLKCEASLFDFIENF